MKFLVILLVLFLGFTKLAQASDNGVFDRGNGGSAVQCKNIHGASVKVLDFYEMERASLHFFAMNSTNFEEILEEFFNRLGKYYPVLEQKLRLEYRMFWKERAYFVAEPLPRVKDLGWVDPLESGCSLKQVAIQLRNSEFPKGLILINMDLWNAFDPKNKAVLIVHELLYRIVNRHLSDDEIANSGRLRVFVGYFFSKEMAAVEHPVPLPVEYQ